MINLLKTLCFKAIINKNSALCKQITLNDIDIAKTKEHRFGHFQFNSIMKLFKENSFEEAKELVVILKSLIQNDEIMINVSRPGFINFILSETLVNKMAKQLFKKKMYKINKMERKKIIIDYSSPNIAKNMHVGHLRSTIVGECLANVLFCLGHNVIKINHLGDWGTQFGILIKYLKNTQNTNNIKMSLSSLSKYYILAQTLFDKDDTFKFDARQEVVNLQCKNKTSLYIWKRITHISKIEYAKIYSLLNVKLLYKGESFYNDILYPIVKRFEEKKLIIQSDNAKCAYIPGFKNRDGSSLPLIIQKSDGGFNYATTDLAALYYRIKYHKADKIIYITDMGQTAHFNMVFYLINKLKLSKKIVKLIHVPLGLMLNAYGKKIKTRAGDSVKLIDLLKYSIQSAKKYIKDKKSYKNIKNMATVIGINTIKYAELSNKINKNYLFDYDKVFKYNGNTASFLMYAYVRLNSIKRKAKNIKIKQIINDNAIILKEQVEIDLVIHLLQYEYILDRTANDLNPNILTLYLYDLSENFHAFFHKCNVINSEYKYSRLIICELTRKILGHGLKLLGLNLLVKM